MTTKRTNSVRIDTLTHYKLTMLSNDLNRSITDLIREAVESYCLTSGQPTDTIPVVVVMDLLTSYNSRNRPTPPSTKIQKPKPDTPLPDWLDL